MRVYHNPAVHMEARSLAGASKVIQMLMSQPTTRTLIHLPNQSQRPYFSYCPYYML